MHKRGKFFAGQFLIDLCNLRREGIPARSALAYEARDLRIAFQRRPDGLDLSLCLLGRPVRHEGANLFPQPFEECVLVIQNRPNRARAVACAHYLRIEFPGSIQRRHPLPHVPVTHVVVWSVHADVAREKDLRQHGSCIRVGHHPAEIGPS